MSCGVILVKQHSISSCKAGASYGCVDQQQLHGPSMWVMGCRGEFRCTADGPIFSCGYPPGQGEHKCACDGSDDWLKLTTRFPGSTPNSSTAAHAPVAVCIFGQMRNHFDKGRRGFPSVHTQMQQTILNASALGVDSVDVFVDTWAELGLGKERRLRHGGDATSGRILDINWQEAFGNSLVSLTVERTPPGVAVFLHGLQMPPSYVRSAPNDFSGTLPCLWKMRGCADAIQRWERTNGFEYAAVISARPDSHFWSLKVAAALIAASRALLQRSSPHDLFWVNTGNLDLRRQVGDKYATGTSAAMRYYLGAWSHVKELWRRHASLPPSEVVADVLVGGAAVPPGDAERVLQRVTGEVRQRARGMLRGVQGHA
eukprot:CAMPEP_0185460852 /NCGR_PEP_ID=MMETSP1365-20130426/88427_1 /TAXON_ID=38817 /ORGANISM="Gephyrocapsa oceanica, Strain RCC1303" /LENGTH=370 /DNA_ID=CAMNT_0028067485 /DNA_START=42 /DNA_END=1153 /DNA_ORIENTATION=-